jgi:hypothetical protein
MTTKKILQTCRDMGLVPRDTAWLRMDGTYTFDEVGTYLTELAQAGVRRISKVVDPNASDLRYYIEVGIPVK